MRNPRVVAAAAATVLGLALSSCAEDEPEPTAKDADETPTASSATTRATSEPASTLSASPSASEPTATLSVTEEPSATMSSSSTAAPAAMDVGTMLLPAQRMGNLNAEWRWAASNDFGREPDGLTACHRATLQDVGAERVAVREFSSDLDARVRAYHLVAGFADDVTARRAYSVLQSWRGDCARRLEQRSPGNDRVHVSPSERVGSQAEAASSYVVIRPTATGVSRIDNVGIAHDDRVLDLVVVKLEGDDFNYPRGRTPAAVGVANATERSG
jgi:hypothetical protein